MKTLHTIIGLSMVNFFVVAIMTMTMKDVPVNVPSERQTEQVRNTSMPAESASNQTAVSQNISNAAQVTPLPIQGTTPPIQESQLENQPVPPESPSTASRCIVWVDGSAFDVTDFRKIHQGGDIFTCGTDMSGIFWSQHDAQTFTALKKYQVN